MNRPSKRSDISVELALPEDAEAICELLRETWIDTYPNEQHGITVEDIRFRTEGEHGERIAKNVENWRKRIESTDGSVAVFVARAEKAVVGMTAPALIDTQRRIGAMYVFPVFQGSGIGSELMEKALEWHSNLGDIYVLVASYNDKAIRFYEKFGFEKTERHVVDEGNVYGETRIPEIEMVRKTY